MPWIRITLVLFLVLTVVAFKFLPWWGVVAFLLAAFYSLKLLGGWFLNRLIMLPFQAKGRVLKGATLVVHSIEPAKAPPPKQLTYNAADERVEGESEADESASDDGPREWYQLKITVTPKPSTGAFQHWEPGELRLTRPGLPWDESDDACLVKDVEIEQDGAFHDHDGLKFHGEQRLRLLMGVQPGTTRLVCRYYFETFGEVNVPAT
jgi:hypothetical protein